MRERGGMKGGRESRKENAVLQNRSSNCQRKGHSSIHNQETCQMYFRVLFLSLLLLLNF